MKKAAICLFALIISTLLTVGTATAATKETLDFQARIVDQGGKVLPDGNYNFRFIIYNAAEGGTQLWSEDRTLPTRRGVFSVDLGVVNKFTNSIFANTDNLFVKICLDKNGQNGDAGGDCATRYEESFNTRKRITSVPWALRAFALGPVNISNGETGYEINTNGADGRIFNWNFNGTSRFRLNTNGNLNLIQGADIAFGTSSLRNSSEGTSGAGLIGAYNGNFTNISGDDVQEVLESIDDLIGTGGGSETDPVWTANRDTNATTINPLWTFNSGLIVGNSTSTTAGTIRYTGSDFEGYDGSTWLSLTAGGGGPETDPVWVNNRDTASTTVTPDWTFAESVSIGTNTNLITGRNTLQVDNSNNIPAGINYDPVHIITNYNTTGGNPASTVVNSMLNEVTLQPGGDIFIARGLRNDIINNNTNQTARIFGNSTRITSNGPVPEYLTGTVGNVTNNSSVGQLIGVEGWARNNGTANQIYGLIGTALNYGDAGRINSIYANAENHGTTDYRGGSLYFNQRNYSGAVYNGLDARMMQISFSNEAGATIPKWYGLSNEQGNYGAALGGFFAMWNSNFNGSTGTIDGGYGGFVNGFGNEGTINNGVTMISSAVSPGNVLSGDVYGINNAINTYANVTEDVFVQRNAAVGSNLSSFTADNIYLQYNLMDGENFTTNNVYGLFNDVRPTSGNFNDLFGIYNSVTPSGSYNAIYGMYSTEGVTDIYLNNGSFSLYTDDDIRLDSRIQFGSDPGDALGITSGSTPLSDLYYGDMIVCDVSEPDCGRGGGGGGGTNAAGDGGEIQFNDGSDNFDATSSLYWDNFDEQLGIRTNNPNNVLDINVGDGSNGNGINITSSGNTAGILLENTDFGGRPWEISSLSNTHPNGGQKLKIGHPSHNENPVTISYDESIYPPQVRLGISAPHPSATLDVSGNILFYNTGNIPQAINGNANMFSQSAYFDPTGGDGSQVFNAYIQQMEIQSGDGSNINRARGIRSEFTNNSNGVISNGVFHHSMVATNNGTTGRFYSQSVTNTNNNIISDYQDGINIFVDNNNTSNSLTALTAVSRNDGDAIFTFGLRGKSKNYNNVAQVYGLTGGVENYGFVDDYYSGLRVENTNHSGGNVDAQSNAALFGNYNASGASSESLDGLNLNVGNFSGANVTNGSFGSSVNVYNEGSITNHLDGQYIFVNNQPGGNVKTMTGLQISVNQNNSSDSLTNQYLLGISGKNEGEITTQTGPVEITFTNNGTYSDIDNYFWNSTYTNNGTIPQFYGRKLVTTNNGTASGGLFNNYNVWTNSSSGTVGAGGCNDCYTGDNLGVINGDTSAIASNFMFGELASGNVYGINTRLGDATTQNVPNNIADNVYGISSAIVSTGGEPVESRGELVGIDNQISYSTTVSGNEIGIRSTLSGTHYVGGSLIGIYNDVTANPFSSWGERIGIWSTDGNTNAYLNYQDNYAFYSNDDVRFDSGVLLSGDFEDRITTNPTSQASSNLYWGDDLLCDPTLVNCGISGGGGGGTTEDPDWTYVTDTSNGFAIGGINGAAELYFDHADRRIGLFNEDFLLSSTEFTVGNNSIKDVTISAGSLNIYGTNSFNIVTSDSFYLHGQQNVSIIGNQGISLSTLGDGDQISFISDALYFGYTPDFNYSVGTANFNFAGDLNINTTGNVSIPDSDLTITNGALCVDGGSGCPGLSAGGIYGDLAYSEFDVAENILAERNVETGDIVTVRAGESEVVRKADKSYDSSTLGVISTDPGSLGGYTLKERDGFKVVPLTLSGRVPVKVSSVNGAIKAGDPITSSDIPGYGMKATKSGRIIGIALEDLKGKEGNIIVMLNLTHFGVEEATSKLAGSFARFAEGSISSRLTTGKATIKAGQTNILIRNNKVTANSVIILTATSSTSNQQLFIGKQIGGQFEVKIEQKVKSDITFNYLINQ